MPTDFRSVTKSVGTFVIYRFSVGHKVFISLPKIGRSQTPIISGNYGGCGAGFGAGVLVYGGL